jgi:hypothetical protein
MLKPNGTSPQHPAAPSEDEFADVPVERPVAILAEHGQLASVAWAYAQSVPGNKLGYVQTEGSALPGVQSQTVRILRRRGLIAGHLTAGAAFGEEGEVTTTIGALHHGLCTLGWDAAVCGPGPGLVGSPSRSPSPCGDDAGDDASSALGHGGTIALDSAHVALALGCPTLLVARLASGDQPAPRRGLSQQTLTVLDLLLAPVTVALPAGMRSPVGADLRAGLGAVFPFQGRCGGAMPSRPALALDVKRPVRITRHDWRRASVDLPAFAASGLAADTSGRGPSSDPLFFAAALAGGSALAELAVHEQEQSSHQRS